MKITSEKDEHGEAITVLRDVFSGVKFVNADGHCLGVCMRDDGYEISVFDERTNATPDLKKPVWFQVDPRTRTISRCEGLTENAKSVPLLGLHCLKPRALQLVQENEAAKPHYTFLMSSAEQDLLRTACGYFLVEDESRAAQGERFAYTVDHGTSFVITDSMSEVVQACTEAETRHSRCIYPTYAGRPVTTENKVVIDPAVDMETSRALEEAANKYNDGETDHYELREYADDLELLRTALKTIGISASHITILAMWSWYSACFQMTWACVGNVPSTALIVTVYRDFIESQKRRF